MNLMDLVDLCDELRKKLEESVRRNLGEGILLSGGLDTSVLAYLASKRKKLNAFTVAFENSFAPDVDYAMLVANWLRMKHFIHYFNERELHDAIRAVAKIMDSFDPIEIRNDVTIYIALKIAKENGTNVIMTGDGCDELFAGYNFFYELDEEKLGSELQRIWVSMSFSSMRLANALNVEVKFPYLDPVFKEFAIQLDPKWKVRNERGKRWGKWILRKAFENLLPEEIVWRDKTPIESGSGTSILPRFFDSVISDAEFHERRNKYFDKDEIILRDKEQLFYYEVYKSVVGNFSPTDFGGKVCPFCKTNLSMNSSYCRKCGAYPI
jgi:asparagine synthase (glutamine-hydrolysing)